MTDTTSYRTKIIYEEWDKKLLDYKDGTIDKSELMRFHYQCFEVRSLKSEEE